MAKQKYDFSKNYNVQYTLAADGPNCIMFADYEERRKTIIVAREKAEREAKTEGSVSAKTPTKRKIISVSCLLFFLTLVRCQVLTLIFIAYRL